jgi:hypothetical protein
LPRRTIAPGSRVKAGRAGGFSAARQIAKIVITKIVITIFATMKIIWTLSAPVGS